MSEIPADVCHPRDSPGEKLFSFYLQEKNGARPMATTKLNPFSSWGEDFQLSL